MKVWYAYDLIFEPIENWDGWSLLDDPSGSQTVMSETGRVQLSEMRKAAGERFRLLGWDGSGTWHFTGMPDIGGRPSFVVGVQQDDLRTFVLSPVPLDHLELP